MARKLGTFKATKLEFNEVYGTGEGKIMLTIPNASKYAIKQIVNEIGSTGIDSLQIDVKKATSRRSLDQNAFMWVLLGELARILNSSSETVYLQMVERYGVFYALAVPPSQLAGAKSLFRAVSNIEETFVNGKLVVKFYGYPGSSQYDKAQMATLLNGIINECEDLNIPTDTRFYEDRIYV